MNKTDTIRVLTVDDHTLLHSGIRYSLLPVPDIELVAVARTGEEAIELCRKLNPDVVLMDIYLEGEMDGIEVTGLICNQFPNIRVIVLSSFFDRDLVQRAIQSGSAGYLLKDGSGDDIISAIRVAFDGQAVLSTAAMDALVSPEQKKANLNFDLTKKEHEVLNFVVQGLSNKEIAQRLNVSVAAVKYHVNNLLTKLNASNRTEAAALARQHNLV